MDYDNYKKQVEKNGFMEISFEDFKKNIENLKPQKEPYKFKITGLTKEADLLSHVPDSLVNTIRKNLNIKLDLSSTEIPDSVTDMSYTFRGCTSLVEAPEIPDSVNSMKETFYGCTSLETIHNWQVDNEKIEDSSDCFKNCTSLKSIYVPQGTKAKWEKIFASGWGFPEGLIISDIVKEQ